MRSMVEGSQRTDSGLSGPAYAAPPPLFERSPSPRSGEDWRREGLPNPDRLG
jgi:hypothetical protein